MNLPHNLSIRLWQILWLCLGAAPLAAVAHYVWQKHHFAINALDQAPPRVARLAGILQSQADIAQAQEQLQNYIQTHTYPAIQSVSEAGNDAQQRVRQTFSDAGLSIVSLQVQDVQEQADFDRIPLSLRIEGPQASIATALQNLHSLRPTVIVNELRMDAVGSVRPETDPRLTAEFKLTVLRART